MFHSSNSIPRVSVLMPVYNAERFLKPAVDSIFSQSFSNFELIAINDGSTDSSLDILKSYHDSRIKIISNTRNLGLIATLNNGLREARAEYVARMDADDISYYDRLKKQVQYLDKNPHIAMVGSWGAYIDEENFNFSTIQYPVDNEEIRQSLLKYNCFIHSSVMFRRKLVLSLGGYNTKALYAEDYDLWLRLSDTFALANISEPLIGYRLHNSQISLKKVSQQRKTTNMCIKWAFERRQKMNLTCYHKPLSLSFPTWWQEVKGGESTVGRDFLYWALTYQAAGKKKIANKLALNALFYSPLSLKAQQTVYTTLIEMFFTSQQINAFKWYKYRVKSIFKGSYF